MRIAGVPMSKVASLSNDVGAHDSTHLPFDRVALYWRPHQVALIQHGDEGAIEGVLLLPRRKSSVERSLEEVDREIPVAEGKQQHSVLRLLIVGNRHLHVMFNQHRAHERLGGTAQSTTTQGCKLDSRLAAGPGRHKVLRHTHGEVNPKPGGKDEVDRHHAQANFEVGREALRHAPKPAIETKQLRLDTIA
jgi:hypothetical protein